MGVPLLYSQLARKYKKERLVEKFRKAHFDNLFIDYNGLIHKVIGELTEVKPDKEIFKEILDYTIKLTKMVNPIKRIILAVDGVAPRAKLNQQRMRRFKSAAASDDVTPVFDRNRVTPGTDFMDGLDVYLKDNVYKSFGKLEVVFSGVNEKGEGEHKMMEYIRDNEELLRGDSNIMNGLDADLIMLTASVNLEFKLLREERRGGFSIIDVNLLKSLLIKDMEEKTRHKLDTIRFMRDFIIISFFLGNDFLTSFPGLKIKKNGIGLLLGSYSMMFRNRVMKRGEYIVNQDKSINPVFLNEYIKLVWSSQKYWMDQAKVNSRLAKHEYYSENFRTTSPEFIDRVSKKYVEGIFWVGEYYLKGCRDFTWYYPFYHTPFSCDINVGKSYTFEDKKEFTPEQQLVSVLPKKSLPEKFREKVDDTRIKFMFPESFKIDNSDEDCPEHARAAFIPFVEPEILFKVMGV